MFQIISELKCIMNKIMFNLWHVKVIFQLWQGPGKYKIKKFETSAIFRGKLDEMVTLRWRGMRLVIAI